MQADSVVCLFASLHLMATVPQGSLGHLIPPNYRTHPQDPDFMFLLLVFVVEIINSLSFKF